MLVIASSVADLDPGVLRHRQSVLGGPLVRFRKCSMSVLAGEVDACSVLRSLLGAGGELVVRALLKSRSSSDVVDLGDVLLILIESYG